MYQVIFNDLSASEVTALPKRLQIDLMAEMDALPDSEQELDPAKFGVLDRDGKKLCRYRAGDYRIYFERTGDGVVIHRILHKNTIRDFLFRTKLPMAEDDQLAQAKGFWELIDEGSGGKGKRRK